MAGNNWGKEKYKASMRKHRRVTSIQARTYLRRMTNDVLWKYVFEVHKVALLTYIGKRCGWDLEQLDLDRADFLNKDRGEIKWVSFDENVRYEGLYVDQLIKVPYKDSLHEFSVFHVEFQTLARLEFSERTGHYKLLLRGQNISANIYTFAFIHRAAKGYKNSHQFGEEGNGELIEFDDLVIKDMPEDAFEDTACPITQILHVIWLYENRRKFTEQELFGRLDSVIVNVEKFGFKGERYQSLITFVLTYAYKILQNAEKFDNFINRFEQLHNEKFNSMTAIEEFVRKLNQKDIRKARRQSEAAARRERRARLKAEADREKAEVDRKKAEAKVELMEESRQIEKDHSIKKLLSINLSTEMIAEILNVDPKRVERLAVSK